MDINSVLNFGRDDGTIPSTLEEGIYDGFRERHNNQGVYSKTEG